MRLLTLLFTVLLFSASAHAADGPLKWSINDTVIKHSDPQFKTSIRIWVKNEGTSDLMVMVKQEGDAQQFKVLQGYTLGVLYPLKPNDSIWFNVQFTADIGKQSVLTNFKATTPNDTATLVIASLFEPIPEAGWDPSELVFIAPNCQTPALLQGFLINAGTIDVHIDSVRIIDDPTNSFYIQSSSPQDRTIDFIIGPGGGSVTYEIIFSPVAGSKLPVSAKMVAFMADGRTDILALRGIVSESKAKFELPTISLGVQPMNEDIEYVTGIDNSSGTGDFVISAVEVLGEFEVTLERLAADTVIEPQTSHSFRMKIRGTSEGVKQAQIMVFGSPCDEELMLTIGAEFENTSGVETAPLKQTRIIYADRYVRFEHDETGDLPYRILDITGRMTMSGSVGSGAQVNVSSLASGTYFAILETPGKPISQKFVKQ